MLKLRLLVFFILVTVVSSFIYLKQDRLPEKPSGPEVDFHDTLGEYSGYGIGIHASDVIYSKAFDDLNPHYVRMEFGPRWDKIKEQIPTGKQVEDYVAYLERNYNADSPDRLAGAQYSNQFLRDRNIEIIKTHFELPHHWRAQDGSELFLSKHIEDLARFHTAHLLYLKKNGVQIHYMELANEPDGPWNGHIPGKDYGQLLKRCDELFEKHQLGDVKILGPGLTFLSLHNHNPPYFEGIKEVGAQHLDGWSTHVWDEVAYTNSLPEYTYGIWKPFLAKIQELDPERKKPLFVTEYASEITQFGDNTWKSPRQQVTDTVVDSWHHAVRVIANSITHLNRGANALVLYRLSNTHWHQTGWGIIQPQSPEKFEAKPIYQAIQECLSQLPIKSKVLNPLWYSTSDTITLSMLHEESANTLHILTANYSDETQTKVINLGSEFHSSSPPKTITLTEQGISQLSNISISDSALTIKMPPLSVARIFIELNNN